MADWVLDKNVPDVLRVLGRTNAELLVVALLLAAGAHTGTSVRINDLHQLIERCTGRRFSDLSPGRSLRYVCRAAHNVLEMPGRSTVRLRRSLAGASDTVPALHAHPEAVLRRAAAENPIATLFAVLAAHPNRELPVDDLLAAGASPTGGHWPFFPKSAIDCAAEKSTMIHTYVTKKNNTRMLSLFSSEDCSLTNRVLREEALAAQRLVFSALQPETLALAVVRMRGDKGPGAPSHLECVQLLTGDHNKELAEQLADITESAVARVRHGCVKPLNDSSGKTCVEPYLQPPTRVASKVLRYLLKNDAAAVVSQLKKRLPPDADATLILVEQAAGCSWSSVCGVPFQQIFEGRQTLSLFNSGPVTELKNVLLSALRAYCGGWSCVPPPPPPLPSGPPPMPTQPPPPPPPPPRPVLRRQSCAAAVVVYDALPPPVPLEPAVFDRKPYMVVWHRQADLCSQRLVRRMQALHSAGLLSVETRVLFVDLDKKGAMEAFDAHCLQNKNLLHNLPHVQMHRGAAGSNTLEDVANAVDNGPPLYWTPEAVLGAFALMSENTYNKRAALDMLRAEESRDRGELAEMFRGFMFMVGMHEPRSQTIERAAETPTHVLARRVLKLQRIWDGKRADVDQRRVPLPASLRRACNLMRATTAFVDVANELEWRVLVHAAAAAQARAFCSKLDNKKNNNNGSSGTADKKEPSMAIANLLRALGLGRPVPASANPEAAAARWNALFKGHPGDVASQSEALFSLLVQHMSPDLLADLLRAHQTIAAGAVADLTDIFIEASGSTVCDPVRRRRNADLAAWIAMPGRSGPGCLDLRRLREDASPGLEVAPALYWGAIAGGSAGVADRPHTTHPAGGPLVRVPHFHSLEDWRKHFERFNRYGSLVFFYTADSDGKMSYASKQLAQSFALAAERAKHWPGSLFMAAACTNTAPCFADAYQVLHGPAIRLILPSGFWGSVSFERPAAQVFSEQNTAAIMALVNRLSNGRAHTTTDFTGLLVIRNGTDPGGNHYPTPSPPPPPPRPPSPKTPPPTTPPPPPPPSPANMDSFYAHTSDMAQRLQSLGAAMDQALHTNLAAVSEAARARERFRVCAFEAASKARENCYMRRLLMSYTMLSRARVRIGAARARDESLRREVKDLRGAINNLRHLNKTLMADQTELLQETNKLRKERANTQDKLRTILMS